MLGNMKNRIWLGFMSTIIFACLILLFTFGYSYIMEMTLKEALKDSKVLIVLFLLFCVFIFTILNIFLGSRRVRHNKRQRKQSRILLLSVTLTAFSLMPLTALSSIGYISYANYPGAKPFERDVISSYTQGLKAGVQTLERHGDWPGTIDVAHAMGGIDGTTYTLSLESFEENYQKGFRVFEVDFVTSTDGDIVLKHYWGDEALSTDKFKSTKVNNKYTSLTFKDLCSLMEEYQDMWIITDPKEDPYTMFTEMSKEADELGMKDVFDRFIIQFFSPEMYETVYSVYPFKNWVYGTYVYWDGKTSSFIEDCKFCIEKGIDSISMWNYCWNEQVQWFADYYDIDVYVHSENDLDAANTFLSKGVRGIYSDFIDPSQLGG